MATLDGAIAVTRFGLGARPGEIDAASGDPRGWLRGQITPDGAPQPQGRLLSSAERLADFYDLRAERRRLRREDAAAPAAAMQGAAEPVSEAADDGMAMQAAAPRPGAPEQDPLVRAVGRRIRRHAGEEFAARIRHACETTAPFAERWAMFWSNLLTVSGQKPVVAAAAGPYEREAIRPNVFGRFEDLLLASSRHPAMLLYLDQAQSIGPDSIAGDRTGRGLNENLAREILELHTLGADAGYTQADVTELARALTGWSVGGPRERRRDPGTYYFRARAHQPGARQLLGRAYPQAGEAQAEAMLRDVARDPRTVRRLCGRIARHFVADAPPPALASRLEAAWTRGGGRLDQVAAALATAPESFAPTFGKLKTPYEYVVSAWRAVNAAPQDLRRVVPLLTSLGQRPFSPLSPAGWSDEAAEWASPDAMVKRLTFAEAFAAAATPDAAPPALADALLGPRVSPATAQAVRRAESRAEAFTVLLMSPEFQRR